MRFDLTSLDHLQIINFLKKIKSINIEDGDYKVSCNILTGEFLLIKIDFIVK